MAPELDGSLVCMALELLMGKRTWGSTAGSSFDRRSEERGELQRYSGAALIQWCSSVEPGTEPRVELPTPVAVVGRWCPSAETETRNQRVEEERWDGGGGAGIWEKRGMVHEATGEATRNRSYREENRRLERGQPRLVDG
jgi:hypothetical protein